MAATALAIGVNLAGLAYLTGTDPKRRRAFRMPPAVSAHPRLGWTAVLAPGLVLPFAAGGGGFTVWIGAVSVIGWAIAALPPERTEGIARRCALLVDAITGFRPRLPARAEPGEDRVAALEARIRALEAQLATPPAPAANGSGNGHAEAAAKPKPAPRARARRSEAAKVVRPN